MRSLISMALSLGLLVTLLRFKFKIGRSMLFSAVALAVFLGVTPAAMWDELVREWQGKSITQTTGYLFVTLTALVLMVNVLSQAMQQSGVSERLCPAMQGLFRSRRVALSIVPLIMGMLPAPGGIMLSAPMVRELGDELGVERSRLATINFYFRHQWEPVWPLFPAIPLVQGILGVSAISIIAHNAVIVLSGILGGVIFLLLIGMPPKKKGQKISKALFHHNLLDFIHAFWPIGLAAVLYAALNMPPAAGILIATIGFLLLHRIKLNRWGGIFKAAKEPDIAVLIFGALLFKLNLQAGGGVTDVMELLSRHNIPAGLIIFSLPFLVAFLTGITSATIAVTFPLLAPLIGTGTEAEMSLEALAFAGVISGLLVTPVHLCLALSTGYFETSFSKIIIKLLPPTAFIIISAVLMVILLT